MSSDLKDLMKQLDWKYQIKQLQRRIKAKQEELRKLTDDELMRLHDATFDSMESSLHEGSSERPEAATYGAIINEVDRRAMAACWFWRRWRRPDECKKWLEHKRKTEERAQQWVHEKLS